MVDCYIPLRGDPNWKGPFHPGKQTLFFFDTKDGKKSDGVSIHSDAHVSTYTGIMSIQCQISLMH